MGRAVGSDPNADGCFGAKGRPRSGVRVSEGAERLREVTPPELPAIDAPKLPGDGPADCAVLGPELCLE